MNGKWHRGLVIAAGIISTVGGLIIITDPSSLGVSAENWKIIGGWFAFGGGIASGIVTVIRANLIPGAETGIAHETTVNTETGVIV